MENLKGFTVHGVHFTGESGRQAIADCPFCGKSGKFYANRDNRLWDCKVCGKKGDFHTFLKLVSDDYAESINGALDWLSDDRKLPSEAFKGFGVGYSSGMKAYTLPIRDAGGKVTDIRTYKKGGKLMSTSGATTGLWNSEALVQNEKIVWLCEGEWDAIAWQWILKKVKQPGVVVGVPGANAFKKEWAELFYKKDVRVLYDNDAAGEQGEITVADRLSGVAGKISFLHWPSGFESGYDIRDLFVSDGQLAYDKVMKWLKAHPRSKAIANASGHENKLAVVINPDEKYKSVHVRELMDNYKKWLHLPNTDVIKIMYGAIIANQLGGDPVWLFMVAPPGGSKSELLMSLSDWDRVHALTSLTPHTLISGTHWQGGKDPSLLPQLDGKMLVIKDFTTLLTMHYSQRDEIFGTLRDIYDGNTEKSFGNGIKRSYNVRFGILAGVTPIIETFNIVHASLGERFLKFRVTGNWDSANEDAKIARALSNLGKEDDMREGLRKTASWYLQGLKVPIEGLLQRISPVFSHQIAALAKFSARLRGVVDRDRFSGMVMYKPSSEIGTRLAKQIAKLGIGISIFLGKKEIDEHVYRLMKRVALDTVPDRSEDIVQALWDIGNGKGQALTNDVIVKTRLPQTTVFRLLQDLNMLRIVDRTDQSGVALWRLSDYILGLIKDGDIYENNSKK